MNIKILVLDDSADNGSLFKSWLKDRGFNVVCAANCKDALENLHRDTFDLVLASISMPSMDGLQLLQECRGNDTLKRLPFILVTDQYIDREDEELAIQIGAQSLIRRPPEPDELVNTIEKVISGKPVVLKRGRKPKKAGRNKAMILLEERLLSRLKDRIKEFETEIKQQRIDEKDLKVGQERYELLFRTIPQGVVFQDASGSIISANPAALNILGLSEDQIMGRTSYDPRWHAIKEDGSDYPGDQHPAMITLQTGQPVKGAVMGVFNPREEEYRWIKIDSIPLVKDGEDKPYQVYTSFTDITDSFLSRKALQESESRLYAIIENTTDAIFSVDRDFHVIIANSVAKKYFRTVIGMELTEGTDILSNLDSERKVFWQDILNRALKGERILFERHYDLKHQPLDFEFSVNPIISPAGYITGISFFGRDITERKALGHIADSQLSLAITLANTDEPDIALKACLESALQISQMDSGVIYLADDLTGDFKAAYYKGFPDDTIAKFGYFSADSENTQLIMRGKPLYVRSDQFTPPFDEQFKDENFTFIATIPVVHQQKITACLVLCSHVHNNIPEINRRALETIASDIGVAIERIRAGFALRRSEEKYRTLLDEMDEAYYEIDEKGNYTFFNDALCRMFGYSRQELMGMNYKVYTRPEDIKRHVSIFSSVYLTGIPVKRISLVFVRKDGKQVYVEESILPIRDNEGKIIGLRGLVHDITERVEYEEKLKSRALLLDSAYDIILAFDEKGDIVYANETAARNYRYTIDQLLSMNIRQLVHPDALPVLEEQLAATKHKADLSFEITCINGDNTPMELEAKVRPIETEGQKINISVLRDITERKRMEEQLRNALQQINTTLEGTIEAIATMSELRDPYTAGHQQRVTGLALAIAQEMGLPEEKIQALRVAGLLHDVGKVYVPSEILSKPGKLAELERNLVRAHAEASYNIVKTIKFPWPVCRIILQHHERIDGSGYPKGLKGEEIELEARILAVADVVEAMMSHRPYRPAMGLDKALEEITTNRGILYDEQVVDACVRLFREKGFNFDE